MSLVEIVSLDPAGTRTSRLAVLPIMGSADSCSPAPRLLPHEVREILASATLTRTMTLRGACPAFHNTSPFLLEARGVPLC